MTDVKKVKDLVRIMRRRKLSYNDVSIQTGITVTTVYRWVNGKSKPYKRVIDMVLKKLREKK